MGPNLLVFLSSVFHILIRILSSNPPQQCSGVTILFANSEQQEWVGAVDNLKKSIGQYLVYTNPEYRSY